LTGGKSEVLRVTRPTIALHGGAGSWDVDESTRIKVEGFLRDLAKETLDLLDRDYSALDAVEYAVSKLEDSGLFNAGYGSSLNIEGGWKAVSAFIIICSAHVHWFVLQLKLISIQSIIVLMMR